MLILPGLLVMAAAIVGFFVENDQQAKDVFCKTECIEYQARVPHNY